MDTPSNESAPKGVGGTPVEVERIGGIGFRAPLTAYGIDDQHKALNAVADRFGKYATIRLVDVPRDDAPPEIWLICTVSGHLPKQQRTTTMDEMRKHLRNMINTALASAAPVSTIADEKPERTASARRPQTRPRGHRRLRPRYA